MPARNVNLTQHFAEFVDEAVASGHYQNASEVVRDGLRLLEERKREDELKLEALREAIAQAKADVKAGRVISLQPDEVGPYLRRLGRS